MDGLRIELDSFRSRRDVMDEGSAPAIRVGLMCLLVVPCWVLYRELVPSPYTGWYANLFFFFFGQIAAGIYARGKRKVDGPGHILRTCCVSCANPSLHGPMADGHVLFRDNPLHGSAVLPHLRPAAGGSSSDPIFRRIWKGVGRRRSLRGL